MGRICGKNGRGKIDKEIRKWRKKDNEEDQEYNGRPVL